MIKKIMLNTDFTIFGSKFDTASTILFIGYLYFILVMLISNNRINILITKLINRISVRRNRN